MSNKLKAIVSEAKKIRKANPSIKWQNAIKAASKKISGYTIVESAAIERKRKKKGKVNKTYRIKRDSSGQFTAGKMKRVSGISELTQTASAYKAAVNDLDDLKKTKAGKAEIAKQQKRVQLLKKLIQTLL